MGKRLEWVKFNFTDWMVGVRRMSWAARGVYMEALCLQFHGERLPAEIEEWRTLFQGASDSDLAQVMQRFDVRSDERGTHLVNARLESEMDAVSLRRDKNKAAAAKRWHHKPNASAMHSHCIPNAIEKRREEKRIDTEGESVREGEVLIIASDDRPILNLADQARRATPRKQLRMPEGALDKIWEAFPKRVGKKTALALLDRAIRDYAREWELEDLADAAEGMRERVVEMAKRYNGTDEKFIPHPSTWLRQGRYRDQMEQQ